MIKMQRLPSILNGKRTDKALVCLYQDFFFVTYLFDFGVVLKFQFSSRFKVQGSLLFVTYTIIQGIIGSEMLVGTGPLNGKCKKEK